jgi:hypothetical protein
MMTEQDFTDLVVTAVEHGGYGSLRYTVPPVGTADEPVSVRIAQAILVAGLPVTDRYGDGEDGVLTRDEIERAAIRVATQRGYATSPIDVGEFDVVDADAVMQIAAFGERIYA